MREILFRGKRIDNGEWKNGYFSDMGNKTCIIKSYEPYWDKGCKMFRCHPSEIIPVDSSTIGQFTGFTDKNGKKIFEGDILRLIDSKPFRKFSAEVVFNDGCFDLINDGKDFRDYLKCYICNCAGEVVGNIYDDPELIRG